MARLSIPAIALSLLVANASAQSTLKKHCFHNRGVKTYNCVRLRYSSPATLEGTLSTVGYGSADTVTIPFTGTIRQGILVPVFARKPQLLGPETEWTTRPWIIKQNDPGAATLSVPVRSKIVNSTDQYRNTDFVFVEGSAE